MSNEEELNQNEHSPGLILTAKDIEESENRLKRDDKGRLVKGTPPGPGRPKGSISIKDKVRQYLEEHPDEVDSIVRHFVSKNRELMWQMLEGRPQQDLTTGGEKINPIPIYGGLSIQGHESNQEDIPAEKQD